MAGAGICFLSCFCDHNENLFLWAAVFIAADIASIFRKRITPLGAAVQKQLWITKCGLRPDRKLLPKHIHTRKSLAFRYVIWDVMSSAVLAVLCIISFPPDFFTREQGAGGYFEMAAVVSIILLVCSIITAILRVKITTRSFRLSDYFLSKLKIFFFIAIIFTAPLIAKAHEIYFSTHPYVP